MYLRRCYKRYEGKRHAYWALVESYRTERGPRQRVIAYLGEMGEARRLGIEQAASENPSIRQRLLFEDTEPEWVAVDTARVRVERVRDFGGGWLGLQVLEKLGLLQFLDTALPAGREEAPWSIMAVVLVLSRLCDPSSELRLAEHLYERGCLSDLLGVPAEKVNDDRL